MTSDNNRKIFIKWIREVINPQAKMDGNAVCLDDFSKDGMSEFFYPKRFIVNGDEYSWDVISRPTKNRYLTTHYELWFNGKAFNGTKKIATGEISLSKIRKGLREIFEYYTGSG